jgi:hypothetical protein
MMMWDEQIQAGVLGQLLGHSIVWGKDIATGTPASQVFTGDTLFWVAFQLTSEYLSQWATTMSGTRVAGIALPAGIQGATLSMYHAPTKDAVGRLMKGEVSAVLESPALAGTIGSVLWKSYSI